MKCTAGKETPLGVVGDHDWVLVPPAHVNPKGSVEGLLWACPCSEFKWTSYTEWEKRQNLERATAKMEANVREATMGQGFGELGTLSPSPVTVVDDKPAESPEEAERRRKELLAWDERRRAES